MFSNIGTTELIVIGVIVVVLFGSQRIVDLARGLGESTKEIKKVKKEIEGDGDDAK